MVIEFQNISKIFGTLRAVDNVSFVVNEGETLSIVGESGSGKSTLAKLMAGLIKPSSGSIIAFAKVQMIFQDPYSSLDPIYPIRAILDEGFTGQKNLSMEMKRKVIEDMLVAVGLEADILYRYPHEFSGGQRQRIAIARALLANPSVLILDEPTSALDVLVQKQILDLLRVLKTKLGLTYIFISHNLRVVEHFSDRIMVMSAGAVLESGLTGDVFKNPQHPYTRKLLSAALNYAVD